MNSERWRISGHLERGKTIPSPVQFMRSISRTPSGSPSGTKIRIVKGSGLSVFLGYELTYLISIVRHKPKKEQRLTLPFQYGGYAGIGTARTISLAVMVTQIAR